MRDEMNCSVCSPGKFQTGVQMESVMRETITARHRTYLAFLERTLPAAEGEARAAAAGRLCRAMGAMQASADEADAEGLTPLMRAAADGAGGAGAALPRRRPRRRQRPRGC